MSAYLFLGSEAGGVHWIGGVPVHPIGLAPSARREARRETYRRMTTDALEREAAALTEAIKGSQAALERYAESLDDANAELVRRYRDGVA